MRVLVTGGAGFIGSHVCESLLARDCVVGVLDDLNDFYPPQWKRSNLDSVRRAGPIEFHHCDIADAEATRHCFRSFGPEAVIHLAARAGVRPSLLKPLLYEQVNVRGTMVILEACREFQVAKLVFASSSSVYGVAARAPFREDDNTNLPISPYAATKIAGEKLCYTYSHLYGLPVVCTRLFTVYGPRQRPDLAAWKFIDRISRGQALPMYGDGASGRDYTYVDDIAAGILAALDFDCSYEVFNLGNSRPIRLRDLIATIEQCLDQRAEIEALPCQPGDVPLTCADIGRARRMLNYAPRVSLEEGIARTVAWYRSGGADRA